MSESLRDLLSTESDDMFNIDESIPTLMADSPYFTNDEVIYILKDKNNAISIFGLNCQSLQSKFDQLKIYMHSYYSSQCPFTIIALQETWLTDFHDVTSFELEGYNLIMKPRSSSSHGAPSRAA